MRQGEIATKGEWIGDPLGGVKAPEPLLAPDPAARFLRTAARLKALSDGHPMTEWLLFMAGLARAQHAAAIGIGPVAGPNRLVVEQAAAASMPPLAIDGHRRDPRWREGLSIMLDDLAGRRAPDAAREAAGRLRHSGAGAIEALADGFIHDRLDAGEAGAALYVAAALQVYFTTLAAGLPTGLLQLLPQRGLCPCCGSTPVAGVVTASGNTPGVRYLYCSMCGTAWNHVRAVCVTCGGSRTIALRGVADDTGAAKAETCDECRTYSKLFYQIKDMQVDPFADDLASLGLDLMTSEAGWARHAPNPLLLIARA